jgi:hypothetical protein
LISTCTEIVRNCNMIERHPGDIAKLDVLNIDKRVFKETMDGSSSTQKSTSNILKIFILV